MNYFLLLIILGLCGGGYYEYTILQQKDVADQQQFSDLSGKIDALQAANKKLEDDEKQLTQSVADISKQPAAGQSTTSSSVAPASIPGATTTPSAPAAPAISNDLGTIITAQKTYQNCHLLKIEAGGVVVKHSEGIVKINYADLRSELQKRFGFDSQTGANLTPEQIAAGEQQRQAAGN